MKTDELFDAQGSVTERLLRSEKYPWEAMDSLCEYIMRVGKGLDKRKFKEVKRCVWVANGATVAESAELLPPLIIEENAEVGGCSSVGCSVIGRGAMIGDFCEIRRCVFFEGARAPSHNYISVSIVGKGARFGAGAIASSVRGDRREVVCEIKEKKIKTGKFRFGVLIGDGAEIGCSSVLCAGCVVERGASVAPLTRAAGFISSESAYHGERIVCDLL